MTRSMTAFARASGPHFTWEIRSVNQRHVDAGFRMPEEYRVAEPELRHALKDYVQRGKLDCALRVDATASAGIDGALNEEALRRLSRLIDHVASMGHDVAPVSPLEVLRWPGILIEESVDFEARKAEVVTTFREALENLVAMRTREGSELERLVLDRLDALAGIVADVRDKAPEFNRRLTERLEARIAALDVDVEPGRLEAELVIMAQKADVQEELDRLETHIREIRTTFDGVGPIGRRLDFLMQELNREANTLSSKSSAAEMSIQAVELKVFIEQMREQIQNIE